MRPRPNKTLLHELQAAGASAAEAQELQSIATQLGQLKPKPTTRHRGGWKFAASLSAAAGVVIMLVALAQNVLPGSPLYSVQQASDSLAIAIHPPYQATVMMRRAEQVRALVNARAPSNRILAALDDYQRQADAYRAHYANYEVFERCKNSLQQAASRATGPDRQAIEHTLAGLQNV